MNQQRHIIKKQIIELQLNSQHGAVEMQNKVSKIYFSQAIPLIDDLCNQFSDLDTIQRIDTLEINLGNIDINNLEQDFITKLAAELRQQLTKKILLANSPVPAQLQANSTNNLQFSNNNNINSELELFSYFILTGTLPWWTEKLSKEELEECCDRLITTSPLQLKSILWESFKHETQLKRIIYHFGDAILLKIACLFVPSLSQVDGNYNSENIDISPQIKLPKDISDNKSRQERWRELFVNVSLGKNAKSDPLQFTRENFANFQDKVDDFNDTNEIYINNAGLILLYPFLNQFFATIGLVKERCFINLSSAERAVLLLQYLVDASTKLSEHILPLNKLLCGIGLYESVDVNWEITPTEHTESENLLSAVIENWSILKNTSIPGFKTAFLQREGILKIRDGSWLLLVERKSYDVLLDRIPWNISVVKLPWMDEVLYSVW
ncbi:MAG: contractile injection system tape measure protein [Gloeotrichia echinulata GP01]